MGETPADTEREITHLRGDMTAALEEVERRMRGGLRGIATSEARIGGARATEDVVNRARQNPTMLGVAGMVAAGVVVYGGYALVKGLRARKKPQNRLKREVEHVREELSEQAERVGELVVESTRRELEKVLPRGVLLKLEPEEGGYVRVSEARLEPPKKKRGQSTVIKKLVWAALLSVFMALGSVVARRVADTVWRAMVHEEPPTEKSKAASSS
jgi:hypothetical protein